jgi:urea transporter
MMKMIKRQVEPPKRNLVSHCEQFRHADGLLLRHQALLDASWKGSGQVIFLNSDVSGKIILASLAIGDPFTASMAALGTASSTMTARFSQFDASTTNDGLYSYNGCLVGCATAVFIAPHSLLFASVVTGIGAASATYVTACLSRMLASSSMPQWTWAFNAVTLTTLLRVHPLAVANTTNTTTATTAITDNAAVESVAAVTTTAPGFLEILSSPLVGLSQIFVVQSAVSGAGIVLAIASYSPLLAAHALSGSCIGCLTGWAMQGAPISDVAAGLWGFNSALTSMGVAVFFRNTRQSQILSAAGAAATASVFGALSEVFGTIGSPCLTLPFCITMSGCWLLGTTVERASRKALVPGLILASNPHSPEKNL